MLEFFNNLNDVITENFSNQLDFSIWLYLLLFLSNSIYYLLFLLKVYRILCFSKITFDGLPMINPYAWPFSLFRVLTQPYFRFWSALLPSVKSGKSSFDISMILGLEAISVFVYILTQIRIICLLEIADIATKMEL
jgi:hypothetical protein